MDWRRRVYPVVLALLLIGLTSTALAQQRELTSSDRQAILYAPQLNFTTDGDPIIRVGIMQDREEVEFTPSESIRVLPQGEGGPEIVLPGNKKYTVSIEQGEPGEYRHWVVVDELTMSQRERLPDVKKDWTRRGYIPESFEVGGLFAIRGKVFDSRLLVVTVGGTNDLAKAQKLKRTLEAKYGIVGRLHSQITEYPTGKITLEGAGVDATVANKDVLWITSKEGREESIRFRVPGIEKSYRKGTETRTYLGTLVFAPSKSGKLVAMNSLGAERLLRGVVPAEIYASAPPDALKAQAVAARNEIFAAIGVRNLADPFMQRADIFDQVYGGVGAEDSRTTRAVDATRGEVMFHGKQIVEAVYSSNAGGFTENNENVWDAEKRPYLRGKPDASSDEVPAYMKDGLDESELRKFLDDGFAANSKNAPVGSTKFFRWTTRVSASEARDWLRETGRDVGRIKDVEVLSRGVSGRVIRLKVTGEKGSATVERELNVRRLFGGLKSGLFLMDINKKGGFIQSIEFDGAGFGHGVGMCQTGATGMASRGSSYKDILNHYFSGIDVRTLY
ncbi:MAG: SpoIID/LytB domain-containing protein [Myxococcota bacterium]